MLALPRFHLTTTFILFSDMPSHSSCWDQNWIINACKKKQTLCILYQHVGTKVMPQICYAICILTKSWRADCCCQVNTSRRLIFYSTAMCVIINSLSHMHRSLFSVFKLSCVMMLFSIILSLVSKNVKMKVTRFLVTKYSWLLWCGEVRGSPSRAPELPCFLCGSIKALMAWQAGLTDSTGAGVLWG